DGRAVPHLVELSSQVSPLDRLSGRSRADRQRASETLRADQRALDPRGAAMSSILPRDETWLQANQRHLMSLLAFVRKAVEAQWSKPADPPTQLGEPP